VMLVFPLDLGHRQKTVDQVLASAAERMAGGSFVFNYVSTLEPACAVHRSEPTAEVTHQAEHTSHHSRAHLTHLVWSSAQTRQHLSDQLPVMPLLVLNGPDA